MANFNIQQLLTGQPSRLSQQQAHHTAMTDQQHPLARVRLMQPGDSVRFEAIGRAEFINLGGDDTPLEAQV